MHDKADIRAVRPAIFGPSVSKDARHDGRAALSDVRLALCHTMLLMFSSLTLSRHAHSQPPRFVQQVAALFQTRLLPPVRKALDGAVASRWPELREALGALAVAVEKIPVSASEIDWLVGARKSFRSFALRRFLVADGSLLDASAEESLDPFGRDTATSAEVKLGYGVIEHAPVHPFSAAAQFCESSSYVSPTVASVALPASHVAVPYDAVDVAVAAARAEASGGRAPSDPGRGGPDTATVTDAAGDSVLGTQPRKLEMRFMKLKEAAPSRHTADVALAAATGEQRSSQPRDGGSTPRSGAAEILGSHFPNLPQPLPSGGAVLRTSGRSTLMRSTKPPQPSASGLGCFFNTASSEYVS